MVEARQATPLIFPRRAKARPSRLTGRRLPFLLPRSIRSRHTVLSSGCACQLRSYAEWTYARRPNLPAWVYSNQIGGGAASTDGRWRLTVPDHDRLHLCRCRIERPSCASQLPTRNYLALPSVRVIGKIIADRRPNFRLKSKTGIRIRVMAAVTPNNACPQKPPSIVPSSRVFCRGQIICRWAYFGQYPPVWCWPLSISLYNAGFLSGGTGIASNQHSRHRGSTGARLRPDARAHTRQSVASGHSRTK